MCLLMRTARIHDLIRLKYAANARVMEITRRLGELQRYAANIADGKLSFKEMTDIPAKLFGRQSIFQMYAHNKSLQIANAQMATMAPMLAMQMQNANPQMLVMYQQNMFMNLYQEARKEAAEEEKKLLNEQETELVADKEKWQGLVQAYDTELKGLRETASQDYQIFRPTMA